MWESMENHEKTYFRRIQNNIKSFYNWFTYYWVFRIFNKFNNLYPYALNEDFLNTKNKNF